MRYLGLLGLCFAVTVYGGCGPADGAVRVLVEYGSHVPACVRISASDGQGHETEADITPKAPRLEEPHQPLRIAVYRKPDWGRELTIKVVSFEAFDGEHCSGYELEEHRTPEPIRVPRRDIATYVVTLQARDDDKDGYVLKTAEVAGKDCDDTAASIHPGAVEVCGGAVDYDCDGQAGCADAECLERACDDGNLCTLDDRCVALGGAEPRCLGTPKECHPPTLACYRFTSACTPETGECLFDQYPTHASCDDGNACTRNDLCTAAGVCMGVDLEPCEPVNKCHLSDRLECPGSGRCTDRINPAMKYEPCGDDRFCRTDGACSSFPFIPSNFDPDTILPEHRALDVNITCGALDDPLIFDSTSGRWHFPARCMLHPPMPEAQVVSQGDVEMTIVPMRSLTIGRRHALKLKGTRPVILAVYGGANLDGALLADAEGAEPGPGGNRRDCGSHQGESGSFDEDTNRGSGGGQASFIVCGRDEAKLSEDGHLGDSGP